VLFRQQVEIILVVMGREGPMTDKARRVVGLVIAALLILVGLWLWGMPQILLK
jgi:hypothetical protein